MNISVIGTGYVGLVTGVCFAEMGNNVTCIDIDQEKIKCLQDGKSPIYEPGLEDLLQNNIQENRIKFTSDMQEGISNASIIFIAVGTPPNEDGSADLNHVLKAAETVGKYIADKTLVVIKSTVPVGTFGKVKARISSTIAQRQQKVTFDLCSNPEFLREGSALEDCLAPHRVVVGVENTSTGEILQRLYEPFLKNGSPLLIMDPSSSEMTKYAANAMLATKISFMNEISRLCEKVGADIESIRRGLGADQRIGPHFIYAGIGYGGSCFPKDVKALIYTGQEHNENLRILNAVEETNFIQRGRFFSKISDHFKGALQGKTIAVWGIAFKPGTDDIREAPAVDIIQLLLKEGCNVVAYDPVAAENAKKQFQNSNLVFTDNQYDCLANADALVIMTEWKSFREPDFARIKQSLKQALIFDGRNMYSPKWLKEYGFNYISIGRN